MAHQASVPCVCLLFSAYTIFTKVKAYLLQNGHLGISLGSLIAGVAPGGTQCIVVVLPAAIMSRTVP